jgi:hypothetical protein
MEPLDQFLVGYLNQDFDLVFGDPEDVVRAFAIKDPGVVAEARRGVVDLLRHYADDDELLAAAVARGCEFEPDDPAEFRALLELAVEVWGEPAPIDPGEPLRTFMSRYLSKELDGLWISPDHPARDFTTNGDRRVALARSGVAELLAIPVDDDLVRAARDRGWGGLPQPPDLRRWLEEALAVWDGYLAQDRVTA